MAHRKKVTRTPLRPFESRSDPHDERQGVLGMSIEVALRRSEVAAAGFGEETQHPVVQDGKDMGQLGQAETAMVFLQAHIPSIVELVFNGLITNDKFCMSRTTRLARLDFHQRLQANRTTEGISTLPLRDTPSHGGQGETQVEGTS